MKARLQLRNATQMVEWSDNATGMMQAKAFRRSHREFKRRRIRSVIQASPEQIECGTVYTLSELRERESERVTMKTEQTREIGFTPELLAACEALLDIENSTRDKGLRDFSITDLVRAYSLARAAIAKARGERL